ncbi:MAG TPA: hypothetical protein VI932_11485 [Bacteroidota bacterium]|nr:hypothetical protein [Bacteroidota bacterium]
MHSPVHFGETESSRFLPLARLGAAAGRFGGHPGAVHLLHGHSSVYTAALLFACASKCPVAVIDGSMRFNSYIISRLSSFLGLAPKKTLARIHVTRSFTAFQTEAAVTSKLPRFLMRTPCPLVVVTGLLDTYYDEQVRPSECRESLGRVMRTFGEMARRGTHVLIADVDVGAAAPPGKTDLFAIVRGGADEALLLMHDGGHDGANFYLDRDLNQQQRTSHGTQQRYLHADHRQEQGNLEQIPSGAEEGGPGAL